MPKFYVESGRVRLVLLAEDAEQAAVRAFQWSCQRQTEVYSQPVGDLIGATVMNTHFHKPPKFFTDRQIVQWHVEVLGALSEEASGVGVTIVLEHVPSGGANQLELIEHILEGAPLLRFHLDSGHAKLEREHDRWEEYIAQLGSKLAHVHLSDNDGTSDQHLPLGSTPRSTTDWPQHIRTLKSSGYDGTVTLEVFAPERDHLLLSRDLLRKWWDVD
jgi:sugar phosphate isomerase/epimerase